MLFSSCTFACVDSGVILLVHASLTVVGKARLCDVVLGVPFFVLVVLRTLLCKVRHGREIASM